MTTSQALGRDGTVAARRRDVHPSPRAAGEHPPFTHATLDTPKPGLGFLGSSVKVIIKPVSARQAVATD